MYEATDGRVLVPLGSKVIREMDPKRSFIVSDILTLCACVFAYLETVWPDSYKCERKYIIYGYSLALGQQSDLAKLPLAISKFVASGQASR